jgi:nitrogen regulatory protein PII
VKPVKRLEIVVDQAELPRLVDALDAAAVEGYTILRDAQGKGRRGRRAGEGLSGEFSNGMVVIVGDEPEVRRIVEIVRPILRAHGGIGLMSDAEWVIR